MSVNFVLLETKIFPVAINSFNCPKSILRSAIQNRTAIDIDRYQIMRVKSISIISYVSIKLCYESYQI